MNIALIILHADPARGGAERYTLDLATGLLRRGHQVSLLASAFTANIPVGIVQVSMAAQSPTRVGRYRRFLDSLDAHLAAHSYDITHAMLPVRRCDFYHPHAGIAAAAIAAGSALSRLGNRLNRRRHAMAAVERHLLTASNPPRILCLSNYVMATVRRCYPHFPQDHLIRLFNGIDLARFDPTLRPDAGPDLRRQLNLPADAIVALMLAQDFARKGLDPAIRAIAAVADPRLCLLVAGRDDPAPYRRLAESLGIASKICFAGPTTDPIAFYHAADFLLLPTRHDPCSLVVLEALAMGLPVISTAQNGACEIMQPSEGGQGVVLQDPTDMPALADAIRSMLSAKIRNSRNLAALSLRPSLSQETHLNTLEQAYRSIAP